MKERKTDPIVVVNEVKIVAFEFGKGKDYNMRTVCVCDCPQDCGHALFIFGGTCGIEIGGTNTPASIYYLSTNQSVEVITHNISWMHGEQHD